MLLLMAAAAWLLHPFATSRMVGTGDALWYANMLADFCLQLRAGIFPIFVGQTDFAFNGAVYPLRVAPLYQHLGGLLDWLTFHRLDWFALQHLCVMVCGIGGLFAAYLSLTALAPNHRWNAAGLAVLYLGCPGVLGTIYTQDLYMTWMTLPFVPVAFYASVRAWQRNDRSAQGLLAGSLAALWWAHSPVALWTCLLVGIAQTARLLTVHRDVASWKKAASCAVIFAALASYPFVSVANLHVPGVASAVTAGLAQQERITNTIRDVFPAVVRPVSDHARALSDLQLGYALWLVLLFSVCVAVLERSRALAWLLGGCGVLLVLLFPVPVINPWLWEHLPEQIKRITFYWPMHRFYLLLAASIAIAAQTALGAHHRSTRRSESARAALLVLAVGWSLWEARQFIGAGQERTSSLARTEELSRPENRLLMNHAYGLFPALPAYFSNGTMDPASELRWLDAKSFQPIDSTPSADTVGPWTPLVGALDANPGILNLSPRFTLEPGARSEVEFEFPRELEAGVLQIRGRTFFREYGLPTSGATRAFGSGPANSHRLSLWSSAPEGDSVQFRYIPAHGEPLRYAQFGRLRVVRTSRHPAALELRSLVPLTVAIQAGCEGWLETPRMFLPGYEALRDEKNVPVARSPEGLAMVAVHGDTKKVVLRYRPPWSLQLAYFTSLAAWAALLAFGGIAVIRNLSAPSRPPAAAS